MGEAEPPKVLLAVGPVVGADVRQWLQTAGQDVVAVPFASAPGRAGDSSAVVVDGRSSPEAALDCCRRLRVQSSADGPRVLYLAPGGASDARVAGLVSGADVCLGQPLTREELQAQVSVLVRRHQSYAKLSAKADETQLFNQRLQQAYQQIDRDLTLARRLQASFLPTTLPAVGRVRFAACYRPCGQVGGDFYDVLRLDEDHVGFYVADAMGHGVPASLLTVFLKKAVQTKEIADGSYRLLPPDEVLARLNRDLIAQELADLPFITMVYALLDCRDGRLQFARAGHPHPLYLPRNGPPEVWHAAGPLLGVFEAHYPVQERRLRPGDRLLLFTDGVTPDNPEAPADDWPRLLAAVERHRDQPVRSFLERLAEDLLPGVERPDDFTLLGVEALAD